VKWQVVDRKRKGLPVAEDSFVTKNQIAGLLLNSGKNLPEGNILLGESDRLGRRAGGNGERSSEKKNSEQSHNAHHLSG